jgi:hypothetical protein
VGLEKTQGIYSNGLLDSDASKNEIFENNVSQDAIPEKKGLNAALRQGKPRDDGFYIPGKIEGTSILFTADTGA